MVDGIPVPKRKRAPRKLPPPPIPPLTDAELRRFVLQTFGERRWTQGSPVVPDVWFAYMRNAETMARRAAFADAEYMAGRLDANDDQINAVPLLVTPWEGARAGRIAQRLRISLGDRAATAAIMASSSRVAADLGLADLVAHVVPLSGWMRTAIEDMTRLERDRTEATSARSARLSSLSIDDLFDGGERARRRRIPASELMRYVALAGLVAALESCRDAGRYDDVRKAMADLTARPPRRARTGADEVPWGNYVDTLARAWGLVRSAFEALEDRIGASPPARDVAGAEDRPTPSLDDADALTRVWMIHPNRSAELTVAESRRTAKVDAAERLFEVTGDGITIAVVDTGIDATHRAFLRPGASPGSTATRSSGDRDAVEKPWHQRTRVRATFDFSRIRHIARSATEYPPGDPRGKAGRSLEQRELDGSEIDWGLVATLLQIRHDQTYAPPGDGHGTHVAGILGADLPAAGGLESPVVGVAREVGLYDMRVFDADGKAEEFSVVCALEYIGWLNRNRHQPVVHGVNLSLAIRHEVDSFACGQTPICDACNRLVGGGTVVVAAAGNTGFDDTAGRVSLGDGYRTVSITDPGNASGVITVGSTHRRDPHAYGVSYFSSRGPTGDGRAKPDLLAPGEKIYSTLPGDHADRLDGTSMAAPHVTGAAALLMARHPELIGRPDRIKHILMSTATDLGRERHFQGAGMVDVLRALQSV